MIQACSENYGVGLSIVCSTPHPAPGKCEENFNGDLIPTPQGAAGMKSKVKDPRIRGDGRILPRARIVDYNTRRKGFKLSDRVGANHHATARFHREDGRASRNETLPTKKGKYRERNRSDAGHAKRLEKKQDRRNSRDDRATNDS
ncbi:hypothetical protein V8E36_008187 [Tilletia maclaganii]